MATFTVKKAAATPTRTITFKNSASSSSSKSNSTRPAVSTPVATKTITFKSAPVPTPSQSISFKTTAPATKVTTTPPPITKDLAAALRNLTDKDKVTPEVTKVIQFKTDPVTPTPTIKVIEFKTEPKASTPPPITVDLAAALRNLTDKDRVTPAVTKVIEFKTAPVEKPSETFGAFSAVTAVKAIAAPILSPEINKTVQSLVKAANEAANVIAKRTDTTWDANETTAGKILITDKIQAALVKAQQSKEPVLNFNNFVNNQLSGMATVAKASVNVATSRVGMAAAQNNADAANALNLISKLASYGMKSAASAAAAQDLREVANQSANHILNIAAAANSTLNQDHAAIVASIGQFVKNNIDSSMESKKAVVTPTKVIQFKTAPKTPDLSAAVKKLTSKAALPTVTKVIQFKSTPAQQVTIKTLNIPPNSKPDVVAKAVYSQLYGDKAPVGTEVFAERYAAILKVVKKSVSPNGTVSAANLAAIQKDLSQKLVVQASEFVTPVAPGSETPAQKVERFNREAAARGDLNPSKPQVKPKVVIPGSGTVDENTVVIGETQTAAQKKAEPVKLTPVAAAAAQTATEKAAAKKKTSSSTPAKLSIDPTKMYKTKSGNLIAGKDIQPADMPYITGLAPDMSGPAMPPSNAPSGASPSSASTAAVGSNVRPAEAYMGEWKQPVAAPVSAAVSKVNAAKNIFGKPTTSISPVTKIITFTPTGMKNVIGSDGKRSVKIDSDIYNSLKQTYKDDQIADLLMDARLGVYVDTKTSKIQIGPVADKPSETFSEDSGIYRVDSPIVVTNPDTGDFHNVPEYAYYQLQKLGLKDAEIAKIPKATLNQMKTATTGSFDAKSGIASLPTTAQEALQLPGERQVGSGLFVEVPLTAAQRQANIDATPDPLKDPWGYLVSSAVQKGEDAYTYLAKPEYKNGYKIEPTVAGLLTFNKIATDLSKPGTTLDNVKGTNGMSSYEIFSATLANASPEKLIDIGKKNPRLIIGASVDNALQGILEAKMGDEFWNAVATGLSDSEYAKFSTQVKESDIEKPMGDIFKGFVETESRDSMPDLMPYSLGQLYQLGKDIIISPVTPNTGVNVLLAPILMLGKAPVAIAKTGIKVGEKAGVLAVVKTAQGLSAVRDGVVIGSVVGDAKDASKFLVNGLDGSKIELVVKGDKVTATEVKEATTTMTKVKAETISGVKAKTEIVPFSKDARPAEAYMGEWKAPVKTEKAANAATVKGVFKAVTEPVVTKIIKFKAPEPGIFSKTGIIPGQSAKTLGITEQIGEGVYRTADGNKVVKVGTDEYLKIADEVEPKPGDTFSVTSVNDDWTPAVVKRLSAGGKGDDVFSITYAIDDIGTTKTISLTSKTGKLSDTDALNYAQEYENALVEGRLPEAPTGSVAGATPQDVEAMQARMDQELADINAQLDSEKAPSGGGGGGDYGGSSSGGSGGATYTPPVSTTDISQWTENTDWGARVRSLDNGKTWQVEDPETLVAMSTTDYEKIVAERIELRRSKYDTATNTYKKIDKGADGKWTVEKYQDSAGGWVTKSELDAERAAIAANNPTFTMGVDGTARIRTNDVTKTVQYLDEMTGNWVPKDVYTALMGSADTPIWNAEGGYYYFKKADGSFEIQNPWTNARQTPDEYGKYLSDKAAAATPVAPTQVQTYQQPSSYDAYVPDLQTNYAASVAPIEARATTVEEATDAWTAFTKTPDFDRIIKSEKDTQILIKAKDGKSLSAEEIDRALYLRSRMSVEGQAAFDAATGGETSANLMPMVDFENMITGNRAQIGTMTDAEIKSSGLPPEKEILVHQTKAEENLGKFVMSNEYQGASAETKKIINAELGYYAGEPSNVSNLLNKFNEVKKDWTIPTSESWDKTVEALRSSKNLITDMPPWWKAENVDFSVSDMVLGNNKYADIIVGEKAKGPTKYVMETAYQKANKEGLVIGGEDGYRATRLTYKKLDGWVVRSPDGKDISFVAKNEFITGAEEAISSTRAPLDMYFWEMPTNVPKELRIPDGADGSIIESVTRVDPFSFPEATWKGLTDAGGLSKDMGKEFVEIKLRTPDGQVWSTIREADKSKAFTVGKKVDLFEQDAIRINGLSGTDIQKLGAADYRAFLTANADEIRNLPAEDLPYLTKYIDETRANLMDDLRASEVKSTTARVIEPEPVKAVAEPVKPEPVFTQAEAPRATKVEVDELQTAWKGELKGMDEATFKDMVARNMDDIEQLDIEKLGLNEARKEIIRGEIKDRNFMRSLDSRVKEINNRVARSRADMLAGKKTKYAHIEEVKQGIEDKNALLKNVGDIKTNFADRFGDAEKIVCGSGTGFAAGLGAEGKALTPLLTIAAAGGAGLGAGIIGMEGMNYKNNLIANADAELRAKYGTLSPEGGLSRTPDAEAELLWGSTPRYNSENVPAGIIPGQYYVTADGKYLLGSTITDADLPNLVKYQDNYQNMSKAQAIPIIEGQLADQKRLAAQRAESSSSGGQVDQIQLEAQRKQHMQDVQQGKYPATNVSAPAASLFTSLDQIDRSAEYVTKSGNLYKGADLVETDLPYVVRKAGGQ